MALSQYWEPTHYIQCAPSNTPNPEDRTYYEFALDPTRPNRLVSLTTYDDDGERRLIGTGVILLPIKVGYQTVLAIEDVHRRPQMLAMLAVQEYAPIDSP